MTGNRESTLGLAALTVALSAWPRLDARAPLRDLRAELGGRMAKLEAGMKELGDRVTRLEAKFELVEACILRRNEPAEAVPAE